MHVFQTFLRIEKGSSKRKDHTKYNLRKSEVFGPILSGGKVPGAFISLDEAVRRYGLTLDVSAYSFESRGRPKWKLPDRNQPRLRLLVLVPGF